MYSLAQQPEPQLNNYNLSCINRRISSYLERFGKVHVGIYQIPDIDSERSFSCYINSVVSSLESYGYCPVYAWSYDNATHTYTLIMLVSGYFRENMDDIHSTLIRLYARYSHSCHEVISLYDVGLTSDITIDMQQKKEMLLAQIASTDFSKIPKRSPDTWHKRLFSCSKL